MNREELRNAFLEAEKENTVYRSRHGFTVNLSNHEFDDADFSAVVRGLPPLPKLNWLWLNESDVGDDGVEAIAFAAKAQYFPQLQGLLLGATKVGNRGTEALADAAKCKGFQKLEALSLGSTQVGNRGALALANAAKEHAFPNLYSLVLTETRVTTVLPEVINTHDAREIFTALLEGFAVNEAKIVVLGEPGVGKSWLRRKFFRGITPHGRRKVTHDIMIMRPKWTLTLGGVEVSLRVWDFGGQHVLIGTHEMFLTERSLCLLVLDVNRTAAENRLDHWLKMIGYWMGSHTPVVVVVTKCDEPTGSPGLEPLDAERLALDNGFQSQLHLVESFTSTDRPPAPHCLKTLKRKLCLAAGQLEGLHARASRDLLMLRDDIEKLIKGRAIVPVREFHELCKRHDIIDPEIQDVHLRTLHNLGAAFYFGLLQFERLPKLAAERAELPPGQLRWRRSVRDSSLEYWVVNPRWIKRPVYAVVRASQSEHDGTLPGWLSKADIKMVMKMVATTPFQVPAAAADVVCGVLKLTELCLEVEGNYFFPRGLARNAAPYLPEWSKEERKEAYATADHCRLQWRYLPESSVHRLMVRWYGNILDAKHWRYGMVVEKHGCQAAVIAIPSEGILRIDLHGGEEGNRRKLFDELYRDLVEEYVGQEPFTEESPREWKLSSISKRRVRKPPKRGARLSSIEKLETALMDHIRASKANLEAVGELLPQPSMKLLGQLADVESYTVTRCFQDAQNGRRLKMLYDCALDHDFVRRFKE
jgi:GTPase SAR1 family protein